jgi:hypothetical protein
VTYSRNQIIRESDSHAAYGGTIRGTKTDIFRAEFRIYRGGYGSYATDDSFKQSMVTKRRDCRSRRNRTGISDVFDTDADDLFGHLFISQYLCGVRYFAIDDAGAIEP